MLVSFELFFCISVWMQYFRDEKSLAVEAIYCCDWNYLNFWLNQTWVEVRNQSLINEQSGSTVVQILVVLTAS